MAKLESKKAASKPTDAKAAKFKPKPDKNGAQNEPKPNKYKQILNKKRKLSDSENDKENMVNESSLPNQNKKPRLEKKKFATEANGSEAHEPKQPMERKKKDAGAKKTFKRVDDGRVNKFKKPYDKTKPTMGKKQQAEGGVNKKELRQQRKQKKIGQNYSLTVNMKKIWETLRQSDTTEETRKKLCSTLFEQVKGKIKELSFAHDTVRVIECLIKFGNEKHRACVFEELKEDFVKMAKCKYARFILKQMLKYGTKEQRQAITNAFKGRVTKLIKHSYACQLVESIFNEYAMANQRNQMVIEFFDSSLAILNDKANKTLKDILEANPYSKEKILKNLKEILSTCVTKTLLMFSLIHKVFLEYLHNCDQNDRTEMIELLSEHLVHMVHTKDGSQVAMECVWFSNAKQRKKIIKGMKSFISKIAFEEYGHLTLLAIFDSVDDTKLVSKGILDELFRSMKEVFDNEYGRKVITYLVVARDSRFFIKDYIKRLEQGDSTDTSKKDPEKRRAELFDYTKPFLREFLLKEMRSALTNGNIGILLPLILDKLGEQANDVMTKIADILLEKPYEPPTDGQNNATDDQNLHLIEKKATHFIIKKLAHVHENAAKQPKSTLLTLTDALISHKNNENMISWIGCNRGCFAIVQLLETSNDANKIKLKNFFKNSCKEIKFNLSGAGILLNKFKEIKN